MATIKQHEALRVPMGWKDQDKALIAQLERIFDDIYKRFGRLAWEDLGAKLQEKITGIEEGAVTAVTWDGVNNKLTVTINDTVNDVVTIATIKTALNLTKDDVGLSNVENKSSATIRGEITSQNVTDALGYTPPTTDTKNTTGTTNKTGTKLYLVGAETQATNPQTNSNNKVYIGTDNCLYSNDAKVLTAHQDISGKKDVQTAKTDPTASGTSATFIDTLSQDTQGVITATKKTVRTMGAASASNAGSTGFVPQPAAGKQGQFLRGDATWAEPADTKNTAGSTDSSSKLFLIGATTQAANPQTYSHDTAYVGTDGCLYSNNKKVVTEYIDLGSSVDLNTVINSGFYRMNGSVTNAPAAYAWSALMVCRSADTIAQIVYFYDTNRIFFRTASGIGGTPNWRAWKEVLSTSAVNETTFSTGTYTANHQAYGNKIIKQGIHVHGQITYTASIDLPAGTSVMAIPSGYRPTAALDVPAMLRGSDGYWNSYYVTIDTNGYIKQGWSNHCRGIMISADWVTA
ncbi:MAG: hypothetical protein J6Y48_12675 [Clostridia bacterium]|nr:hypothetical protein [Clostridia bacterium]